MPLTPVSPLGSTPAHKAAVEAMRHWSTPSQLVRFALDGHGYMNTDSFFGITYPNDLDEYDRANGENIPPGYIEVSAGNGDPHGDTHLILETVYVELLQQFLIAKELPDMADQIAKLKIRLTKETGE